VGVIYLGGRPYLVKQPDPEGGVAGHLRRKDLDRHLTVQALVVGQADDGYVPLAFLISAEIAGTT
jgi:hypothetical protein